MSQVKLILRDSVPGLGEAGDVVTAKPGYARNFLLPQGKAVVASEARVKEVEHQKAVIAEKVAKELKDLKATRSALGQVKLEVAAQAGEEGKLFGSVTSMQIAELLKEKGYDIDRRKIEMEPIKDVGEHKIQIKLHRELVADVTVEVTAAE